VSHYDAGVAGVLIGCCQGWVWSRIHLLHARRIQIDVFLREIVDLKRAIVPGNPVWVTLGLASFYFCSEGNDKPHILLPNDTPKVLRHVSHTTSYRLIR
jgi:hypothetical protein